MWRTFINLEVLKPILMKKLVAFVLFITAWSVSYCQNVSFGTFAGVGGNFNTMFGYGAGFSNMADGNTFMGHSAGTNTLSGGQNTFIGFKSGFSNVSATQNHFIGYQSGFNNTTGFLNHFDGNNSGFSNTTGTENQFIGNGSGFMNTSGGMNLFIGYIAGRENTTASNNTFIGNRSGGKNTTGSNNYFSGFQSGFNNVSGSNNNFIGFRAGFSNVSGSGNLFIGNNAGYSETGSNKLYIDNSETASPLIYGDFAADLLTIHGKLGVGTTTPTSIIEVVGDDKSDLRIRTKSENAGWGMILRQDPSLDGLIQMGGRNLRIESGWDKALILGTEQFSAYGGKVLIPGGNVGIRSSNPEHLLQVKYAYCDGNTWYNVSDKNMKENFARVKQNESILDKIMELPIQYWNYKGDNTNRHIGPTAQDFHQVFGLGNNDKAISTIDESGVALAAIQELNTQTQELKRLLEEQQQLIASLLQAKIENAENTISAETGLNLHQNQPNPFQRDTKITMDIPQTVKQATLYVYDLQGKTVQQQPIPGRGATSIVVEGGKLSSGVYLYMLIADGKATGVKRMILTE
jgi:hypothetical protein